MLDDDEDFENGSQTLHEGGCPKMGHAE